MAKQEGEEKVNYRISLTSAPPEPVFYLAAIVFDILSLIPIVNDFVLFIGQCLLALMFAAAKVNVLSRKNWIWYLATWLGELIWPISIFPLFVFSTWRMIFIAKREDEIKSNPLAKAGAAATLKSGTGRQIRSKMQSDRRNEKKGLEDGTAPGKNTMKNARDSRDAFKYPREKKQAEEYNKNKDINSGVQGETAAGGSNSNSEVPAQQEEETT